MITVNLTANTDLNTVEDFEQLVIAERDGGVIRIRDVADAVLGAENYDADVRFAGEPAVFMGIWVCLMPIRSRSLPGCAELSACAFATGHGGDHCL